MKIELKDKNALVGASSQGIGLAIATELAQCGANVTLMARDEKRMEQIIKQLPITHPNQRHGYLKVDFSDFQTFNTNITTFFENHTIDILVNNTNGPMAGKATELGIDQYQQAFDLLFKSVCLTTLLALKHMKAQKFGRIINVSSISVKEPIANLALSNSIRSATAAWAKTLATEVAADGITVNNIMTGLFYTDRLKHLIDTEAAASGKSHQEIKDQRESQIPMKRFGKPEEYGHLACFLASEYASYITGVNIPIDGGLGKGS
ncbi:SDR family oxidoreductase [Pedobacter frigiditerrae]|uniref:SDR family oxidoreductase n=1 Tax=Pedobacter frigiditerrae TaxID=2530452 RepID=UPI00292E19D7|nr:SDR family oxidoreductase [Pedobacter frigiditerrae]